jgi:hypothetical protein
MPRGNDTAGNATFNQDLHAQYGIYANAEEMIHAHRAAVDYGVVKALLLHQDEEETEKVQKDLDKASKKLDLNDGETLIAAAVHGNALVGVVEDEQGRTRKVVGAYNDRYEAPKLSPEEQAQQDAARASVEQRQEIARLRAEHEEELERFRVESQAKLTEALEEIKQAAAAATSKPEAKKPISRMTSDELDARAEELGIDDYDSEAKVDDKREAVRKAQEAADDDGSSGD